MTIIQNTKYHESLKDKRPWRRDPRMRQVVMGTFKPDKVAKPTRWMRIVWDEIPVRTEHTGYGLTAKEMYDNILSKTRTGQIDEDYLKTFGAMGGTLAALRSRNVAHKCTRYDGPLVRRPMYGPGSELIVAPKAMVYWSKDPDMKLEQ